MAWNNVPHQGKRVGDWLWKRLIPCRVYWWPRNRSRNETLSSDRGKAIAEWWTLGVAGWRSQKCLLTFSAKKMKKMIWKIWDPGEPLPVRTDCFGYVCDFLKCISGSFICSPASVWHKVWLTGLLQGISLGETADSSILQHCTQCHSEISSMTKASIFCCWKLWAVCGNSSPLSQIWGWGEKRGNCDYSVLRRQKHSVRATWSLSVWSNPRVK